MYYFYTIENTDNELYFGSTDDLRRRLQEHNANRSYATKGSTWELIYYEAYRSETDAPVIVTGDGDFHCLLEYLLEQEKLSVLVVPNKKKYSALLKRKDFLPHTRFVADIRNKVEKKKDPNADETVSG